MLYQYRTHKSISKWQDKKSSGSGWASFNRSQIVATDIDWTIYVELPRVDTEDKDEVTYSKQSTFV